MKKNYFIIIMLLPALLRASDIHKSGKNTRNYEQLDALLEMLPHNNSIGYRAPTPPSGLTSPLGALIFKASNGGTTIPYTEGADVTAYHGATGAPTPGQTLPANVIMSTVPTVNIVPTPRVFIGADGKIGIGNFGPTNGSSINAALQVEGDNSTGTATPGAANALHIGPRTTALNSFYTTATRSSGQIDGDLYVAQNTQTQGFTSYGLFDPLNTIPIRQITNPITINELSATYTISAPGKYVLYANATAAGNPAINITASNVVLDLQGFTLTGGSGGIQIANGISNVTIRNGRLTNFSGQPITIGTGVNSITIKDITIDSCQRGAIAVAGGDGIFLENIRIDNMAFAVTPTVTIISCSNVNFLRCNNILMTACHASGFFAAIIALQLQNVTNGTISNVIVADSQGAPFSAFDMSNSQNLIFDNCHSLRIDAVATDSTFFGFVNTTNSAFLQYYNCSSQESGANTAISWQSLTSSNCFNCINNRMRSSVNQIGFNIDAESVVMNCQSSSQSLSGGTASGYHNMAGNLAIINSAAHNFSPIGFLFEGSSRIIARNGFASGTQAIFVDATAASSVCVENLASASGGFAGFPAGGAQNVAAGNTNGTIANNSWLNTNFS